MARTHLAITVDLVHGVHTGDLWPRPGRVLIAARTATFEQLGKAIDDAGFLARVAESGSLGPRPGCGLLTIAELLTLSIRRSR